MKTMSTHLVGLVGFVLALLLAPLLPALVNRVKAIAAGRRGQPLLQGYRDLIKLLRRGAVYSRTTSWIFRAGPVIGLAASGRPHAGPWAGASCRLRAPGLLALLLPYRSPVASLGSAFEGMGASREVVQRARRAPAPRLVPCPSGRGIRAGISPPPRAAAILAAAALFVVFLAENARVPVDDPTTHLELTMIHEVMVLDHTGPDLALIEYGAALKLWAFGSLVVGALVPRTGRWLPDLGIALAGLLVVAVVTGAVESTRARLRLRGVPQLLVAASVLAVLSLAVGLAGAAA
jgi:formate hydrogenlyase subunit 4